MDIKLFATDVTANRAGGGPTPSPGVEATARRPAIPEPAASLLDQLLIKPLDEIGALQILVAEVRAELALWGDTSLATATATANETPRTLVELFLDAVPDTEVLAPAAWASAVTEVQSALLGAMDRAVETVAVWHDVAPPVVDTARDTREWVLTALGNEPSSPLWLRPEWLGLAPRMERFRRRRRYARGALSDPDLTWRDEITDDRPHATR